MKASGSGKNKNPQFVFDSKDHQFLQHRSWFRALVVGLAMALVTAGAYVPAQAEEISPEGTESSEVSPATQAELPPESSTDQTADTSSPSQSDAPVDPSEPSSNNSANDNSHGNNPHGNPGDDQTPTSTPDPSSTPDATVLAPAPLAPGDPFITVNSGGIRTGALTVGPMPNGATFEAIAVTGSPAGGPFTCTLTDSSGSCDIHVPSGYRWDVKLTSAASGYYLNPTLDYGGSSTVNSDTYSFRTGTVNSDIEVPGTNPNGTYADVRHPGENYFSGLLASSLDNPAATQRCGLDVAMVLDQSGSMSGSKQTDLKAAANGAIDALTGTPSQLALYTFAASTGPSVSATSTSTVSSALPLHAFVDGLSTPSGLTNWDAGIYQVPSGFDLVIVLTDGAPTTYDSSGGAGGESYFKYVEEGIFSANALKSLGSRMVAVGIGINGSEANLRSISGPTQGSDYYLASTENFDDVLHELATGTCNTQLTIQKQIQDPSGADISDSVLANGWTFDNTISDGTIDPSVSTGVVNNQNGFAAATVSVPVGTTPVLTVTEALKPGYTLTSASCSISGVPVTTQLVGTTATFTGASDQPMSCIFVNRQDPGAWTLTKSAAPASGTSVSEGQEMTYTLTAANNTDVAVIDAVATDDLSYFLDDATLGTLPAGLSLIGTNLTWTIGSIAAQGSVSVSFTVTVDVGAGGSTLVNSVTPGNNGSCVTPEDCVTTHQILSPAPLLTLSKLVVNRFGGPADASAWTLEAMGPETISGMSGDSTITSAEVEAGTYSLSENSALAGQYEWSDLLCMSEGHPIVEVSVSNPSLTLRDGDEVTCTFTNSDVAAALTLEKIVDNNEANTDFVPSDFDLFATPLSIAGQDVVSGAGGFDAVEVFAGSYQLSETGPDGLDASQWQCAGGVLVDDIVTVMNGEAVSCRITNTALDPILTLIKVVDNGDTGGQGTPADWTLTADGRESGATLVTGLSGEDSVTNVFVPTGTFLLSEEGTLEGYTSGDWVCDNGYTGSELVLGLEETVSCTITNTATAPVWSVEKTSNPASGQTVMPGDTIDYTVVLTHQSGVVPAEVTISDDLSDVLDNASWGGVDVDSGSAELNGTSLTWTAGEVGSTATMTYSVVVDAGAYNQMIRNVITPPTGGECVETCFTENPTPHFVVQKSSDPASGSLVNQGDTITYTLTASNDSLGDLTGAWATDDLSSVLDNATLGTPLASGLSLEADGFTLRWDIPEMTAGSEPVSVEYTVTLSQSSAGATITNVLLPGDGGDCMEDQPTLLRQVNGDYCSSVLEVRDIDLSMTKSHSVPGPDDAVESGNGSVITYDMVVTNNGSVSPRDDVSAITVTDQLPEGLSYDLASLVAPDWDITGTTDTILQASYIANDGVLVAGASSTLSITAIVGIIPKPIDGGPFSDLVNRACVSTEYSELDLANNCSSDIVRVKWTELDPTAICPNNVASVFYAIPVFNGASTPTVTMIWWTAQAYADRDPSISPDDTAALLADGAQFVDDVPVPADWVNGDTITGVKLWPGSAVDAMEDPIAWPGWSQDSSGMWFLNPAAPFYAISSSAVIEVWISSGVASEAVTVDMLPGCNPSRLNTGLAALPNTGMNPNLWFLAGIPLIGFGTGLLWWNRRQKKVM